jgi:hypothetical protein
MRRERERNEAEERLAAHGCQIRQAACQGFMAYVGWSVGIEREVSAFEYEICCEDEIVPRSGAENGTVVANASDQTFVGRKRCGALPDPIDQCRFAHRRD